MKHRCNNYYNLFSENPAIAPHHANTEVALNDPPVAVLNLHGRGPVVLICEHASRFIPDPFGALGLSPQDQIRHIAWDIGALGLASELSGLLDAPLVHATYSRLLLDLNRPLQEARDIFERLSALNPAMPVVIVTEKKTEFEQTVAERVGALLEKPFRVAALIHAMEVLLRRPPETDLRRTARSELIPNHAV